MTRTTSALSAAALTAAAVLAIAGCGGTGGGAAGPAPAGPTTAAPASSAGTASAAGGASAGACTGGLTGAESGVIRIVCDGPARIRVQAGSLVKQFTGGQCQQAGDLWSATDGVITQAGVYHGPPVDVVSVNKDSTGGGTIQLMLGGRNYFVEGASLKLSDGGRAAHLHGTTTQLSDLPGTPVTVDVAC